MAAPVFPPDAAGRDGAPAARIMVAAVVALRYLVIAAYGWRMGRSAA